MNTKFTIRAEKDEDTQEVSHIVRKAFEGGPRGYSGEAELITKIRSSKAFIPSLSLVAFHDDGVIGHILLSRVEIETSERTVPTLILAPVAVLPQYQGKGVGGQLIEAAHARALALGENHVFLLGYAAYYPRFGYQPSRNFGIVFPEGLDTDNCMGIELVQGSLSDVSGTLKYSPPFYEI